MFPAGSLLLVLGALVRNSASGAPSAPTPAGKDVDHHVPRSRFGLTFQQDIVWQSCEAFGVERPLPGLYCTHVEVPMDYHNMSAGIATLAVIKYTAVEPGKSKGSVFINPGMYPHRLLGMAALIYLAKAAQVGLEQLRSPPSLNP